MREAAALIRLKLVLGGAGGFQWSFDFSSLVKSLVSLGLTTSAVCAETAALHTSATRSPCGSMSFLLSGSCFDVALVPFSSIPRAPYHGVLSVDLKYPSNIPFSMSLFEVAAQGERELQKANVYKYQ